MTEHPGGTVLLGDIGGTNARFALLAAGQLGPIRRIPVGAFPRFVDALEAVMGRQRLREAGVIRALLGVAGAVRGDYCELTNSLWRIDGAELCREFGLAQVELVNDFAALAWGLPELAPPDLRVVGGGQPVPGAPAVVLGAGTGLGCACLAIGPQNRIVIETEGGHATLPGTCAREDAVIAHLRGRFEHVSAERALSGGGLVSLYEAIAALDGIVAPARRAMEITAAALDGTCPLSRSAVDMFCALFGTVAGNAALSLGARGGVYIAGGIIPRIAEYFAGSPFRARFEAKGRLRSYVSAIPTCVILHQDPAFVGLRSMQRASAR
jgi:glucokinase